MQIQISWFLQKPTDLDLHCLLLRRGMSCAAREGLKWHFTIQRPRIKYILIHLYNWAAFSEKVPSNMRKMYIFRSSCACATYHPGLCSPVIHSVASTDSFCGQWMPWPDCATAQADLDLRCPYMPEDTFSHGMAHTNQPNTNCVMRHLF